MGSVAAGSVEEPNLLFGRWTWKASPSPSKRWAAAKSAILRGRCRRPKHQLSTLYIGQKIKLDSIGRNLKGFGQKLGEVGGTISSTDEILILLNPWSLSRQ